MQSENDNIEGLFRRASDDYPLNTGSANWERVANMLDKQKPAVAPFFSWKKLLGPAILGIIFLGAATIGVNYVYGPLNKIKAHQINNTIAKNDGKPASRSIDVSSPNIPKPLLSRSSVPVLDQKQINLADRKILKRNAHSSVNILFGNQAPSLFKNTVKLNGTKSHLISSTSSPASADIADNSNANTKSDMDQSGKITSTINDPKTMNQSSDSINKEPQKNRDKNVDKDQELNKTLVTKKLKTAHQYLYATALLGPDISNIKQQSYDQAGLSAGVLIGFSKNKWLVETGIVWDKKYYYSNGKYFNPKTTSLYKTIDLSGNCNMYEIPINLGFKLISSNHGNLTIKSGLSSYLMKKEFYNYNYYNSYYQRVSGSATYMNSTNNWFSVMNWSLNYSYKIDRSASIGIEPYFKVPLQGLGYGRLPISSSGLYVVLSKKLF